MPIRKLAKSGRAEDVTIPDALPYAAALSVLVRDLKGTGISFDPDTFYSEEVVELDNIASPVTASAKFSFMRFLIVLTGSIGRSNMTAPYSGGFQRMLNSAPSLAHRTSWPI
jgi:hypothetical protein